MKNVPEIRFSGFTDDWEQRKLSDLCSLFTDGDWIEAKDQSTEGVRLVQTGNVGVTQYLDKTNNAKWISEDTFSRLKCEEIFEGDILISRLPDPAGRACIMPNLGTKMITAVDCTIVRTLPDVNSEYLVQYLSTERYFKEINACLAGGTRQRVSRGNLAEFDIPLPNSADEQRAIGNYFKSLDHLITLHQRKLDKLKQFKAAMLDKMFPKEGANVPEIRFAGFTGDWEQRELGDVFVEYSEKGHDELPPLTIIQGKGTILREESERNLIYDKSGLKNYKLVNQDDFILHLRSFEGGLEKANSQGIVSPAYHIFHGENADTRFYYPFFRSKYFISVLLKPHVYGIRDGKSIDVEGMKTIDIPYPTIEEQNKIGDYFARLDSLITLHQRKLDKLKQFKSAMLDKMFI